MQDAGGKMQDVWGRKQKASLWPAVNTARLTVRDALAYE
jgi:hypothetical protein